MHKKRWIETYFLSDLASLSSLPSQSFGFFPCLCFPLPPLSPFLFFLFLRAIIPESSSSGRTPLPTKPINTVYVIDPSACLVYTVCARLRPKETLTFHTQGSSNPLSRIIVPLKSQSEPIMWEGSADDSGGKHSGLCECG